MNEEKNYTSILEKEMKTELKFCGYKYTISLHENMAFDKRCELCNVVLGLGEMTHVDAHEHAICDNCYNRHILPVNKSTEQCYIAFHLNPDMRNLVSTISVSTPLPFNFTNWLNNQPDLRHEFYMFIDKSYEGYSGTLVKSFFIPQFLDPYVFAAWIKRIGINEEDCIFRTLDTFPTTKGKFSDVTLVYNNQQKTHRKNSGDPITMYRNAISDFLGEEIKGTVTFFNSSLFYENVFDENLEFEYKFMVEAMMHENSNTIH